jgi:hypothetical protein
VNLRFRLAAFQFIAAVLCGLLVPVFAGTGELFRYRLRTKDGRQFEYVFESSAEPSAGSITREESNQDCSGLDANVLSFAVRQY